MKKMLSSVTLLAIDCTETRLDGTIYALLECMKYFNFQHVKLLTHEYDFSVPEGIINIQIPKIKDINEYNRFMFLDLVDHVTTSHVLTVQDHGYIINPDMWDHSWLQYDYIGAPWPLSETAYIRHDTGEHVRVGNGGFSLRSRFLLETPQYLGLPLLEEQGWYNEDGNICVYHRKTMLEAGIRYAPIEVAAKFSFENYVPEVAGIKSFGFHRNMPGGRV